LANLGCIGMAAGSSRCGGVLLVEIKAGGDDPVSETGIASNIAALSVTCADILQYEEVVLKTMFHSSISADTQLNVHRLFFWVFNELLAWSHVRRHSSTCGSMYSKQCFIVQSVPRLNPMFIDCFSGHSMNFWSRVTCSPLAYIGDSGAVFSRILSSSLSPPAPSRTQTPNQISPILHDG
jgi:hypothetical protein